MLVFSLYTKYTWQLRSQPALLENATFEEANDNRVPEWNCLEQLNVTPFHWRQRELRNSETGRLVAPPVERTFCSEIEGCRRRSGRSYFGSPKQEKKNTQSELAENRSSQIAG